MAGKYEAVEKEQLLDKLGISHREPANEEPDEDDLKPKGKSGKSSLKIKAKGAAVCALLDALGCSH